MEFRSAIACCLCRSFIHPTALDPGHAGLPGTLTRGAVSCTITLPQRTHTLRRAIDRTSRIIWLTLFATNRPAAHGFPAWRIASVVDSAQLPHLNRSRLVGNTRARLF